MHAAHVIPIQKQGAPPMNDGDSSADPFSYVQSQLKASQQSGINCGKEGERLRGGGRRGRGRERPSPTAPEEIGWGSGREGGGRLSFTCNQGTDRGQIMAIPDGTRQCASVLEIHKACTGVDLSYSRPVNTDAPLACSSCHRPAYACTWMPKA